MPGFDGYELWHNENGSITFQCTPTKPGTYRIAVEHDGTPLEGLPVCCVVQVAGEGYVTAYKAGNEADIDIDLQQAKDNLAHVGHGLTSGLVQGTGDDFTQPAQGGDEMLTQTDDSTEQQVAAAVEKAIEGQTEDAELEQFVEASEMPKQEMEVPEGALEGAVAMEIADNELPDEITDIKPIVDLGIGLPPSLPENTKFILEKAQADPQDPNAEAPVYIIKEPDSSEINILFDQNQEHIEAHQAIEAEMEGEAAQIQDETTAVTMYLESTHQVETPYEASPSHSELRLKEAGRSAIKRTPGRKNIAHSQMQEPAMIIKPSLKEIPKEVLNPELNKVDSPILIGPGQNTKSMFIRKMTPVTRAQQRRTEEAVAWVEHQPGVHEANTGVTGWDDTTTILIQEGDGQAVNIEPETSAETTEWLAKVIEEAQAQAQTQGVQEESVEAATVIKQEPTTTTLDSGQYGEGTSQAGFPQAEGVSQTGFPQEEGNSEAGLPQDEGLPQAEGLPQDESMELDTSQEASTSAAESMSPVRSSRRLSGRRKFKCRKPNCEETFNNKKELDEHMANHPEGMFVCPQLKCKRQFTTKKNFLSHTKNAHQEDLEVPENTVACSLRMCDKMFPSQDEMKEHLEQDHTEKEKRFMCKTCGRVCTSRITFEQHMETHSDEYLHRCKELDCGKTFKNRRLLEQHSKKHVEGAYCTPCQKPFSTKEKFNRHCARAHAQKEVPKEEQFEMTEDGKFICPICQKSYTTRVIAQKHVTSVHGNDRFDCTVCDATFKTKENLKRHEKTHDNRKPFMCDTCGDFFKTKDILRCHRIGMHSVEQVWEQVSGETKPVLVEKPARPFACKYCDRTFKRKAVLKEHLAIHESTQDIPCTHPGCHKVFPTKSLMRTHVRSVHKVRSTGCQCPHEDCGKIFKTPSALQVHINGTHLNLRFQCIADGCEFTFTTKHHMLSHYKLKHTNLDFNYACSICEKRFRLKEQVKAHLDVHKADRPYECQHCSKTFATKSRLTAHLKIHKVVGEHNCYQCGKSFIRKYRLQEHLRKHNEVSVSYTVVQ